MDKEVDRVMNNIYYEKCQKPCLTKQKCMASSEKKCKRKHLSRTELKYMHYIGIYY